MNPAGPKIVHVVYRETLNQVLESQVLRPAARLLREPECPLAQVEVVALTPPGLTFRQPWRQKLARLKQFATRDCGIAFHTPVGMPARWQKPSRDDALLVRTLRKVIKPGQDTVLHCRGPHAARCGLKAVRGMPGGSVVFDCRGDDPAEAVARAGLDPVDEGGAGGAARKVFQQALEHEQIAVNGADRIACVSGVLGDLLRRRHRFDEEKISILPCAVDGASFSPQHRDEARRELGFGDRFVLGYLGSANWYQCIDESLDLFHSVLARSPEAHFFAITTDLEPMRRALALRGVCGERFTLLSLPAAQVARFVPAMDAGLLIRRRNAVNAVASPVKFGEYLASGVPVILTPGIGDFSAAVDSHRIGQVVDFSGPNGSVDASAIRATAFDEDQRRRCRNYAEQQLSTDRQLENFYRLYGLPVSSTPFRPAAAQIPATLPAIGA